MRTTVALALLLLCAPLVGLAGLERASPQSPPAVSTREQLVERIEAEVAFARGLVELTPGRATEWNPLVAQAEAIVKALKAGGAATDAATAVARAEALLAPLAREAKSYTVHSVGHAHIDMNWMWPWPETVAVTNDTFTTVLKLMDEFPDFCFTQSQASVYALAKRYNPELFEKIRRRVAEGRWEVAAVHWVEGDKTLASGEALARHLLYTRQFMKAEFGLEPEQASLDWEPDTFGHAETMPAVLARAGVKHYYMCRGGPFEMPPVFLWEAPDGSRVLVNYETTWYLNRIGPHLAKSVVEFSKKTGLRDWMNVFGVGDHGGGPTRRDILAGHEMNTWPIFPRWVFTTARQYYAILDAQRDKLPVLKRELNFEFTGCYTTQTSIKRFNRLGESQAQDTEATAALAWRALGRPYPGDQIREAWIDILFGQFHDILPGSGVRATREYQSGLFQRSAATFGTIRTSALRAIADALDTSFAGAGAPRDAAAAEVGPGDGCRRRARHRGRRPLVGLPSTGRSEGDGRVQPDGRRAQRDGQDHGVGRREPEEPRGDEEEDLHRAHAGRSCPSGRAPRHRHLLGRPLLLGPRGASHRRTDGLRVVRDRGRAVHGRAPRTRQGERRAGSPPRGAVEGAGADD